MTLARLLLSVHIIAVAAWLGASLALLMVGPRLVASGAETAHSFYQAVLTMSKQYYNVAGVVVLATGVGMVLNDQARWESTFVSIGFLAVIIGAVMGPAYFIPQFRQGAEVAAAGDAGAAVARWGRVRSGLVIDVTVLVVTIVAMVSRWGL